MSERFFFSQDNSGHWYIVPASRRSEWRAWCDLPEDDETAWDSPEWAERINSVQQYTFATPESDR